MPLYQYQCKKCNHFFEEIYTYTNRDVPSKNPCPSCGEKAVKKNIGTPQIADPVKIGTKRPDSGFKEVLSKIKEAHPRGSL
jgi:putative FmdB family regulatory protein